MPPKEKAAYGVNGRVIACGTQKTVAHLMIPVLFENWACYGTISEELYDLPRKETRGCGSSLAAA